MTSSEDHTGDGGWCQESEPPTTDLLSSHAHWQRRFARRRAVGRLLSPPPPMGVPLLRTHKRGKHPGQNLLREGGREGGGRRPSSSRVLEGNNKAQGQSAPPAQPPRPLQGAVDKRGLPATTTAWPRCSVGTEGSTSQHHRPSSLAPSLSPSPSVPQGHHSGGRRRPQRPSPKHLIGLPHGETPVEGGEAARVGILLSLLPSSFLLLLPLS